ncbi:MAG: c-type cytochrome [Deltaproteobacteria bacterium]|nr:c-type cytochrome [Deltaproteobacteria bacterium]
MKAKIVMVGVTVLASFFFVLSLSDHLHAQQKKKEIAMGPYFQTLKPNDRIDASIARGQKLFNELGCAGCHPRGGTIGGTAVDATGNRMNIQIPTLRGAALHYPRRAASGFMATVGTMNDL